MKSIQFQQIQIFPVLVLFTLLMFTVACKQTYPVKETHFAAYNVNPSNQEKNGQFDDQFHTYEGRIIDSLGTILTPVTKNNWGILDAEAHYTLYGFQVMEGEPFLKGEETITVKNQFGAYEIRVWGPNRALFPAVKNSTEDDPTLPEKNHYLIYENKEWPERIPVMDVTLEDDQFNKAKQVVKVKDFIQFLCVPAEKRIDGQVYPIVDAKLHYAAYPIENSSDAIKKPYKFVDQLFTQNYVIETRHLLFVPSHKERKNKKQGE